MLQVNNISKQFGGIKAIDNLSFRVKKGQFILLLDPMEQEKQL